MADEKLPHFAEDEDLERAKTWWKSNGRSIILGIVIGLGGVVGFNTWSIFQKSQGENASVLYDNMLVAENESAAKAISENLMESYAKTPYASNAALLVAKMSYESGEIDEAITHLQWVLDNALDQSIQHIARLRLASVYLSDDRVAEVESLIESVDGGSFSSRYEELRGDIDLKNGDIQAARGHYTASLESLPERSSNRNLLQLKLDNLGG